MANYYIEGEIETLDVSWLLKSKEIKGKIFFTVVASGNFIYSQNDIKKIVFVEDLSSKKEKPKVLLVEWNKFSVVSTAIEFVNFLLQLKNMRNRIRVFVKNPKDSKAYDVVKIEVL